MLSQAWLTRSKKGLIDEKLIDDAVRRVLRVKFELGVFEDPYADPDEGGEKGWPPGNTDDSALAEKAAEEAVVL